MSRDTRLFIRLDLDYPDHPKIMGLSDAAFRAHVTLMAYSRKYMTDGYISNPVANRLALQWDTDVLTELQNNDPEKPSLIKLEGGGYELHGYADMQETRAEIEARQRRNAANGKKGGRPRKSRKTRPVTDSDTGPLTDSGTQTKAETETETETEVLRAKRLPTSWKPTPSHIDRAKESGLDLEREVIKFKAWVDEKQATSKSWNQRFTRWLINAEEYANRNRPPGTATQPHHDPWAAGYARLEKQRGESA